MGMTQFESLINKKKKKRLNCKPLLASVAKIQIRPLSDSEYSKFSAKPAYTWCTIKGLEEIQRCATGSRNTKVKRRHVWFLPGNPN